MHLADRATGRAAFVAVFLPVALVGLTAAAIVPTPLSFAARVIQHLQSLGLQALTAGLAATLAWRAASVATAPARTFWKRATLASILTATGLVVYAISTLVSGGPSYPSAADIFLLASLLTLGAALAGAGPRDGSQGARHPRLPWLVGVVLWIAVLPGFLWPAVTAPANRLVVVLNNVFVTVSLVLFVQSLARVIEERNAAYRRTWIGIAATTALLVVERSGFIYLKWLDLFSDVHPINLARVAAFGLLAGSAVWHREVVGAPDRLVWTPPTPIRPVQTRPPEPRRMPAPREWVWRPAHAPLWDRVRPLIKSREMLVLVSACTLAGLVWLARMGVAPTPPRRPPVQVGRPVATAPRPTPVPRTQVTMPPTPAAVPPTPTVVLPTPAVAPTPAAERSTPAVAPRTAAAPTLPAHIRERHEAARQLLEAGRLRDAQDEYLTIILAYRGADDAAAMRGLVGVRRRMANDDPALLRQQAQVYRRAIAQKIETDEHYTGQAMEFLAQACLLAAKEIETRRRPNR